MIKTDNRPSSEVLMESLAEVEGATRVVILMQKNTSLTVKTNCTHKDLQWILAQGQYCTMRDLFSDEEDR